MRARSRDISNCSTGSARLVHDWFNCPLLPSYLFVYFYQVTDISFFDGGAHQHKWTQIWRKKSTLVIGQRWIRKVKSRNHERGALWRWLRLPVLWPGPRWRVGCPASFVASDWWRGGNPFPGSANQGAAPVTSRGNPLVPLKCAAASFPLPVPSDQLSNLWEASFWENWLKVKKNFFWNWKKWVPTEILKLISHFFLLFFM